MLIIFHWRFSWVFLWPDIQSITLTVKKIYFLKVFWCFTLKHTLSHLYFIICFMMDWILTQIKLIKYRLLTRKYENLLVLTGSDWIDLDRFTVCTVANKLITQSWTFSCTLKWWTHKSINHYYPIITELLIWKCTLSTFTSKLLWHFDLICWRVFQDVPILDNHPLF